MPSISKKNDLRIFASASTGPSVCLALKDFTSSDGESMILIHTPGAAQAWRRIDLEFDVMDVACAPEPFRERADYIALASTGESVVLGEPQSVQRANPPGTFEIIEPGKGMLSALEYIRGTLFALGRGGQAYRLTEDGRWSPLTGTPPVEEAASDHINFTCGAALGAKGVLAFGGVTNPVDEGLDDISGDLLAENPSAFVDAIFARTRSSYGTLWLYAGGRWRKVEMPTAAGVTSLLEFAEGRTFFSTDEGLVARLVSADEIAEVYVQEDQKHIAGLFVWNGRLTVLLDDEVVRLDLGAGTEDPVAVPAGFEEMQNMHPESEHVWLVDWRGLARWTGSGWEEVTIPRGLLR